MLTGEHNLVRAGRAILKMGPDTVLVKRGEYGVLQFSEDAMFAVPAYPLEEVVDPTGAGDTFAGGFMGFLARHGRVTEPILRTAVVYGSVLASFVVERFSLDRLVTLTWEEIDQRYRAFIELTDSQYIAMELSIVIPLFNERDNLAPLHEELARVLGAAAVVVRDPLRRRRQDRRQRRRAAHDQGGRPARARVAARAQLRTDRGAGLRTASRPPATWWSRSTATARTIRPTSRACWPSSTRATTW